MQVYNWNSQRPFYKGSNWKDYISQGGVHTSFKDNWRYINRMGFIRAWVMMAEAPSGTMLMVNIPGLVPFKDTIIDNFETADDKIISPFDLPSGYYKHNTILSIVTRNQSNRTLTQQKIKFVNIAVIYQNPNLFTQLTFFAAERLIDYLNSYLLVFSINDAKNYGIWIPTGVSTTVSDTASPYNTNWLSDVVADSTEEESTKKNAELGNWLIRLLAGYLVTQVLKKRDPVRLVSGLGLVGYQIFATPKKGDIITDEETGLSYSVYTRED